MILEMIGYNLPMTSQKKIGIAGCGIGGLAAAVLLVRQGHQVTIFDQFDTPSPVGSGLVIQPVGQAVLNALGVLEPASKLGARINRLVGTEAGSGQKVLDVTYGKEQENRFGLALHRASLFGILYDAARGEGIEIVPSAKVTWTELRRKEQTLHLTGGRTAGPFDLIIDASGIGSLLSPLQARKLPFGALWGTVNSDQPDQDMLVQYYNRASEMIGALPVGYLPGGSRHQTGVFWSLSAAAHAKWLTQPISQWRATATAIWPEFAQYAEQIGSHDDLSMAWYYHGNLKNPTADRLVFIGDAAHRASPQLGQGANMALLDAWYLADALRRFGVDAALEDYARNRRWHLRFYQMMSAVFTPMYQSDSLVLPFLRNYILAPASRVPPLPWVLRKLVCGELAYPGALVQAELDSGA